MKIDEIISSRSRTANVCEKLKQLLRKNLARDQDCRVKRKRIERCKIELRDERLKLLKINDEASAYRPHYQPRESLRFGKGCQKEMSTFQKCELSRRKHCAELGFV